MINKLHFKNFYHEIYKKKLLLKITTYVIRNTKSKVILKDLDPISKSYFSTRI